MKTEKLSYVGDRDIGFTLMLQAYNSLHLRLTAERISFRLMFFLFSLTVFFMHELSNGKLLLMALISLLTAPIWNSVTDKTERSIDRLEKSLIEMSISNEHSAFVEKVYVDWKNEKSSRLVIYLLRSEPFIWSGIEVLLVLILVSLGGN